MGLEWQKIVQSLNFTIVANLVNFAILLGILSWLLYRPARKFINQRKEAIKNRIENAQEKEKEAQSLEEQKKEELTDARKKGREIIENAEKTAKQIKEESRKEAEEKADQIVKQAKKEAEKEVEKAREELREEYINGAVLGAQKILKREINPGDHKQMIESLMEDIEKDGEIQ